MQIPNKDIARGSTLSAAGENRQKKHNSYNPEQWQVSHSKAELHALLVGPEKYSSQFVQ